MMSVTRVPDTLAYMAMALVGIQFTLSLSRLIDASSAARAFDAVGCRTLPVLALHVVSFKIVSFMAILVLSLPAHSISSFMTISGLGGVWWLAYTIVGLAVPLALDALFRKIRNY